LPYGIVAANDPVNKIDPSGKSFGEAIVALSMIAVILTIAIFKPIFCDNQVTTHPNQLPYDTIKNLVASNNLSGQSNELITCQCWKESGFNPNAQGVGSSARGLMQVTKGAAHDAGYSYDQLLDPATNIHAGSKYLKIRIQWAGGDVSDGLDGYGTGEGYAPNILSCESCLKRNPCGAKLCLNQIHR
jgi:hypothetical protein